MLILYIEKKGEQKDIYQYPWASFAQVDGCWLFGSKDHLKKDCPMHAGKDKGKDKGKGQEVKKRDARMVAALNVQVAEEPEMQQWMV